MNSGKPGYLQFMSIDNGKLLYNVGMLVLLLLFALDGLIRWLVGHRRRELRLAHWTDGWMFVHRYQTFMHRFHRLLRWMRSSLGQRVCRYSDTWLVTFEERSSRNNADDVQNERKLTFWKFNVTDDQWASLVNSLVSDARCSRQISVEYEC